MAPPPQEPSPREKVARFATLGRRALSYWKVSALLLVAGCAIAVYVAMHVKLIYRSECIVLFKPSIRTSDRQDEESPADRAGRLAPKLKEVLTTRSRLEQIIREYGLYPKIVDSKGMVEAVDEMRNHVGFRGRDSETFVISYENESPEVAAQVTQRLADTMVDEFTKSSVGSARQEADFLAKQVQTSESELENANKALATFLTMHPEFAVQASAVTGFGSATGVPTNPAAAGIPLMPSLPKAPEAMGDPQLAVLYRQKARLEAEMRNAQAVATSAAPAEPVNGGAEAVARLVSARDEAAKNVAQTQAELADKRTHLTDEHPDVRSAKLQADGAARQLHQVEVQLAAARAAAIGKPPPPSAAELSTSPELQKRLAALDGQIAARAAAVKKPSSSKDGDSAAAAAAPVTNELVELETEWQRLLRVLHDVKLQHDDLKQRLERARLQASAAVASGGDQMQMLDPAYKPTRPSQGGRTKTALLGGFMALFAALGYAFARVGFNDTVLDQGDIDALGVIPVLGVLPRMDQRPTPAPAVPPPTAPQAPSEVPDGA